MRRFVNITLAGFLLIVLMCIPGCSTRKSQAEQLASLDSAYQSGVLTKDEYEAKKAALLRSAPAATATAAAPAPTAAAPPVPAQAPVAAASPTPQPVPAPVALPPAAPTPLTQARDPQPAPIAQNPSSAKAAAPQQSDSEPAPSAGCEDAEYRSGKNGPESRFFPMPLARVKKATIAALAALDFTIHKDTGNEIEASKRRHVGVIIGAGGERELLRFEPVQQGNQTGTRVIGETKKSVVGRLAQKSWTAAILAQTACNLR